MVMDRDRPQAVFLTVSQQALIDVRDPTRTPAR
jgi:hypothetical protein